MSWQAVKAALDADLDDAPPRPADDPTARYGCSRHVLKLVLIALADRADSNGASARAGIRQLGRRAGCNLDTVRVALAHLRLAGLIHLAIPSDGHAVAVWNVDLEALELSTSARVTRALPGDPTRAERAGLTRAERAGGPAQITTYENDPGTVNGSDLGTVTKCAECGQPTGDRTRWRCNNCQQQRFGT